MATGDDVVERLPKPSLSSGDSCRRFAAYVTELVTLSERQKRTAVWFVMMLARQCANVDHRSLRRPRRFWRQLRQEPPRCFGPHGFRPALVDDFHPARHYSAFVMVGFFLPAPLAVAFGWLFEAAQGLILGRFSRRDVGLSRLAVRHGRAVRRQGPAALPALIRSELCEQEAADCGCQRSHV